MPSDGNDVCSWGVERKSSVHGQTGAIDPQAILGAEQPAVILSRFKPAVAGMGCVWRALRLKERAAATQDLLSFPPARRQRTRATAKASAAKRVRAVGLAVRASAISAN